MNRSRGSTAALAAVMVLAVQVVLLGNQWLNDQVYRHVRGQTALLLYSAAAQSTWRIPRSGDNGYALVADLRAVVLLVLAYGLVRVVSRTGGSGWSRFVSAWGAVIIAAALAGAVYGIAGRHLISASGVGAFTSVVQTMSAGAGYAVLGGWVAAVVATVVGRSAAVPAGQPPAASVEDDPAAQPD